MLEIRLFLVDVGVRRNILPQVFLHRHIAATQIQI